MNKVLVTGATGFIGRHLVKSLLEDGRDVAVFVRDRGKLDKEWIGKVRVFEGDVSDKDTICAVDENIDVVFHLAAVNIHTSPKTVKEKEYLYKVNVEGTKNILEVFSKTIKHFIFFSSISVYDGVENVGRIDENTESQPVNDYGRSKLMAEKIIGECEKSCDIGTTILRAPFVYGPGNKGNILKMIEAIDRGRFIMIGRGEAKRTPVYIANLVEAAMMVMGESRADGKTYIVTDGKDYAIREIYEEICRMLGQKAHSYYVPVWFAGLCAKAGDIISMATGKNMLVNSEVLKKLTREFYFSSNKIRNEIGYVPGYDLFNAPGKMVDPYKKDDCK